MRFLIFIFFLASGARSCREVSQQCEAKMEFETATTIDQVIADIQQEIEDTTEFFAKYDAALRVYALELESKLRNDKALLERLLKLQERHKKNDQLCSSNATTSTSKPPPTPFTEQCRLLATNQKLCENCILPVFDVETMIHTCTIGYAFDLTQETRQVRCEIAGGSVQLVYAKTSAKYSGQLACHLLKSKEKKESCDYRCAQTAACSANNENKLVCACLQGYDDVSTVFGKQPGSICTKCKHADTQGTDYVMLYDTSVSINATEQVQMRNFLADFLKFIDLDNSDNRFALIQFSTYANLRFPLEPKIKADDMIASMKANYSGGGLTSTLHALQVANEEVYAKLPSTPVRPRVTILFTDGQPTIFTISDDSTRALLDEHVAFQYHRGEYASLSPVERKARAKDLEDRQREAYTAKEHVMEQDLRDQVDKMTNIHKAKMITVYIGKAEQRESGLGLMRIINPIEDNEISVDNFEDLKEIVLDKLQTRIC